MLTTNEVHTSSPESFCVPWVKIYKSKAALSMAELIVVPVSSVVTELSATSASLAATMAGLASCIK